MIVDQQKKREHIKDSSLEQLLKTTQELLGKMDLKNIERRAESILQAEFMMPGTKPYKNIYLLIPEKLSKGYELIEELAEQITKRLTEGASKIFIIANDTISKGFQDKLQRIIQAKDVLEFWDWETLLELIDNHYSEYWQHNDHKLLKYETAFRKSINESNELRKLREYGSQYEKLLKIFIEPTIFLRTSDKQSSQFAYSPYKIEALIAQMDSLMVIQGLPGSGKTRLLKEIGIRLIDKNASETERRYLPIFIDSLAILDYIKKSNNSIDLIDFLLNDLLQIFESTDLAEIASRYQIVLLIDTIDEFEPEIQDEFVKQIGRLKDLEIKIFLGSRSISPSFLAEEKTAIKYKEAVIQKFNETQIHGFLHRYFEQDAGRAESLIQSLQENKIIEKLPITPLNLSLISLLYEEKNYEIPATITDIYSNFSNLLLGKTVVNSRLEFLDITVKETIISTYALELLKRENSELMTKDEFIAFFEKEFEDISGTVRLEHLPEALDYIINHTGILVLHNGEYVRFLHDSYMEFYAAKEIFQNRREEEELLIDNFMDVNWQFAAIFYAGFSRKQPKYLHKIIEKVKTGKNLGDYFTAISGLGYILQSLYLTGDQKRKEGVIASLDIMVKMYDGLKLLSSQNGGNMEVGKFSMPILGLVPMFIFLDNFDSITLKQPLALAIEELLEDYLKKKAIPQNPYLEAVAYQIILATITMASTRINDTTLLEKAIDQISFEHDDFFEQLLLLGIDNSENRALAKKKDEILRPKRRHSKKGEDFFLRGKFNQYFKVPARNHRFTKYDRVSPNKRVKIFTEGKTDAKLIEHAYFILTGGDIPYWEIQPASKETAGAHELTKLLESGPPWLEEDQIAIGIYDNDAKGIQELGGLKSSKFDSWEDSKRIKKHKDGNVFGMLLPVPEAKQFYIKNDQSFNFFAIEHYFSEELLRKYDMIEESELPNIYKIKDKKSSKNDFANLILKLKNPEIFKDFFCLFQQIDEITGEDEIEYLV